MDSSSSIKGLFTTLSIWKTVCSYIGGYDTWRYTQHLLSRSTKQFFDENDAEFQNFEKNLHGDTLRLIHSAKHNWTDNDSNYHWVSLTINFKKEYTQQFLEEWQGLKTDRIRELKLVNFGYKDISDKLLNGLFENWDLSKLQDVTFEHSIFNHKKEFNDFFSKLLPNVHRNMKFFISTYKKKSFGTLHSLWYNATSFLDLDSTYEAIETQPFDSPNEFKWEIFGFNMNQYSHTISSQTTIKKWLLMLHYANMLKNVKEVHLCSSSTEIESMGKYIQDLLPNDIKIVESLDPFGKYDEIDYE